MLEGDVGIEDFASRHDWCILKIRAVVQFVDNQGKSTLLSTDSRFCKQTIGLVLLARFHYTIHCFPGVMSQEYHQVLIAVKMDSEAISG